MISDELIAAYASGEIPETEREQVEAALRASPEGQDQVARYQRLFLLLAAAAAEDLDAPADLETRIARQVAVNAYLTAAFDLMSGLLGTYGRAIAYYLRLS